jgi:hypothetical protein
MTMGQIEALIVPDRKGTIWTVMAFGDTKHAADVQRIIDSVAVAY